MSKDIFSSIRLIPKATETLNRRSGSIGEIYIDKNSNSLRIFDGNIVGGIGLARSDLNNVTNAVFLAKAQAAGVGSGGGNTTVTVSATEPQDPDNGNLWLNTANDVLYVYKSSSTSWLPSSGDYDDLEGTPVLSTVATSGDYDDLINQPSVPSQLTDLGISDGDPGQFLTTDGSGNFSFQDVGGIGDFVFTGSNITTDDSSSISFTPSVQFNSDVIIDNELSVEGDVDIGGTAFITSIESNAGLFISAVNGITIENLTTFFRTNESLSNINGATGIVTHDLSRSAIFYHTNLLGNFTAAFSNVETTNSRAISVVLILDQGATARIPNVVTINGIGQTIRWAGGSPPSGNNNCVDLVCLRIIRESGSWTVLGSLSTFN